MASRSRQFAPRATAMPVGFAAAAVLALGLLTAFPPAVGKSQQWEPPVVALPTLGGRQLWTDLVHDRDWRIQQHALTGHYRLLDPWDRRHAWGTLETCRRRLDLIRAQQPDWQEQRKVVILLHGLGRTRYSMDSLGEFLQREGNYHVVNFAYASTRASLSEHAEALASVIAHLEGVEEINFVAHSLGNLVVRRYLALARDQQTGVPEDRGAPGDRRIHRMVMLAPPNRGSQLADALIDNPIVRTVIGPSAQQLADLAELAQGVDRGGAEGAGRAAGNVEEFGQLAVPEFEFGIIAGRGPLPTVLENGWIEGRDDWFVGVEETKLPGAADFLVLPLHHGAYLYSSDVRSATLEFLKNGYFQSEQQRQRLPGRQIIDTGRSGS